MSSQHHPPRDRFPPKLGPHHVPTVRYLETWVELRHCHDTYRPVKPDPREQRYHKLRELKGIIGSFLEKGDPQQRYLVNIINDLYLKTDEFLRHADKGWLIPSTFHLGIFQIPLKPLLTSVGLDEHKLDKFLSDPKDVNEHKRVMYLLQRSLKPKHDQIPEAKTHPPRPASRTSHHKRPASQASTVFELDVSSTIPEREEGPQYPSIKAN